MVTFVILVKLT